MYEAINTDDTVVLQLYNCMFFAEDPRLSRLAGRQWQQSGLRTHFGSHFGSGIPDVVDCAYADKFHCDQVAATDRHRLWQSDEWPSRLPPSSEERLRTVQTWYDLEPALTGSSEAAGSGKVRHIQSSGRTIGLTIIIYKCAGLQYTALDFVKGVVRNLNSDEWSCAKLKTIPERWLCVHCLTGWVLRDKVWSARRRPSWTPCITASRALSTAGLDNVWTIGDICIICLFLMAYTFDKQYVIDINISKYK